MNFPCIFPVKVMGANQDDFESLVVEIIQKHAGLAAEEVITTRLSRGGRFLSLTVRIHAESQEQLELQSQISIERVAKRESSNQYCS